MMVPEKKEWKLEAVQQLTHRQLQQEVILGGLCQEGLQTGSPMCSISDEQSATVNTLPEAGSADLEPTAALVAVFSKRGKLEQSVQTKLGQSPAAVRLQGRHAAREGHVHLPPPRYVGFLDITDSS